MAIFSISKRVHVEARNQATALAIEAPLLMSEAQTRGVGFNVMLEDAKARGLRMIVVSEELTVDAVNSGNLQLTRQTAGEPGILVSGAEEFVNRFREALFARFKTARVSETKAGPVVFGLNMESLRNLSLGANPFVVKTARASGLDVIVRLSNQLGATSEWINFLLAREKRKGADFFLAQGEQVLGQRDLVKTTADALEISKMTYVTAEFSKIAGDEKLSVLMKDNLVRLHSFQSAEIDKSTLSEYIERYVKAARERGIRILLIRPLSTSASAEGPPLLNSLELITKALVKEGVPIGSPKPFADSNVPRIVFVSLGFLALLCELWLLNRMFESPQLISAGTIILLCVALCSTSESFRHFSALAAAIIFPMLAYYLYVHTKPQHPLVSYVMISAVSLTGGLVVAGLLNGLVYFAHIEQFTAVKLAHFLPIVLITLALFSKVVNWKVTMNKPLTWLSMATFIFALVALAFMLSRTGNDNPAGVSGIELKLRSIMEWLFYARPRTKEFILGNPALLLGLLIASKSTHEWQKIPLVAIGALSIGAIGQTSIVNTMCHFHTPVLLSISRIGIGLLLGAVIGYLLWGLYLMVQKWRPATQ